MVNYAQFNLRHTTYEHIMQSTKRVYPAIGHLRVDKISYRQLQSFVNSMAKDGVNEHTGQPLARRTIARHLSFISSVLGYAVRADMITDNPCSKVTLPKDTAKEKEIYSQEEMQQLLDMLADQSLKYRVFFYLIAYSGFRLSEMLGLEWKDIDFQSNIISVRRTSHYAKGFGTYADTTKTKRSQRTLKTAVPIMEMLGELKAERDAQKVRMGDKWVETDRVFIKWNGETMGHQTPYKWLKKFCKRNDLPFHGIHSFRHFAASSMISAGLDVTTVSGALGHSNSGTTLNVYGHMFQTAQARVADAMDNVFGFLNNENQSNLSAAAAE